MKQMPICMWLVIYLKTMLMFILLFFACATSAAVLPDEFYQESPCAVASLAPYLDVQASDWCGVERAMLEAKSWDKNNVFVQEHFLKQVAIRCALLVNGPQNDILNTVMARFVSYWKKQYCFDYMDSEISIE